MILCKAVIPRTITNTHLHKVKFKFYKELVVIFTNINVIEYYTKNVSLIRLSKRNFVFTVFRDIILGDREIFVDRRQKITVNVSHLVQSKCDVLQRVSV